MHALVLAQLELRHAVVDVGLCAGLRLVVAEPLLDAILRELFVLVAREELLVGVLGVALERRRRELRVGAREIGVAPRRARLFLRLRAERGNRRG